MNTPTQAQRGRKRKAEKQQQQTQAYQQPNRGYQQPLNESQRRQQAILTGLGQVQDKAFPQTPQAGHGAASAALTYGDVGSGMGAGISIDDEFADNVVDDLDRLTPRDLAAARYTRNHEMLDIIFDARRVDKITPPSSYYSTLKKSDLENRLSEFQREISEMKSSHSKRMKPSSEIYQEELKSAQESKASSEEPWERDPSDGKILGIYSVRATTPVEVKEFYEKQKQSLSSGSKAKDSNEVLGEESEEERRKREMDLVDKVNSEHGVGIQFKSLNENDHPLSNPSGFNQEKSLDSTTDHASHSNNDDQNQNQNQNQNQDQNQHQNQDDEDQIINPGENDGSSFDELLAASGLSADAFNSMDSPRMDFNQEGASPQN